MFGRNIGRSKVKNIYKFPSQKCGKTILLESSLEFDTCFHLEHSNKVTLFKSQPFTHTFNFNGKGVRYTPDFETYLWSDNGKYSDLLEVKPKSKVINSEFRDKFSVCQESILEERGQRLLLITEEQIRVLPHFYGRFNKDVNLLS